MKCDRRTFLQGSIALGLGSRVWLGGQGPLWRPSALAATSGVKRALLIGIPGPDSRRQHRPLKGCAEDVSALATVLTERYGFKSEHIITPTGIIPTRLIDLLPDVSLAREDGLLVYFSGFGVFAPPPSLPLRPTWEQALPYLGLLLPTQDKNGDRQTILALSQVIQTLQSLKNKRITIILDCGFASIPVLYQGNLRSRSAPPTANFATTVSQEANKVNLGNLTLISAAAPGQTAVEGEWKGHWQGLFTAALVQALWEATTSDWQAQLWEYSRNLLVPRLGDRQRPQWQAAAKASVLLSPQLPIKSGDGWVSTILKNGSIKAQFVGISALVQEQASLSAYYQSSTITDTTNQLPATGASTDAVDEAVDEMGSPVVPLWQVVQMKGQQATLKPVVPPLQDGAKNIKAPKSINTPAVGDYLTELYRPIPLALGLTVALADDLERIERVDATSAFTAIACVEGVANVGEGAADCVFGKLSEHRYTLFLEGGYPLQPLTQSEATGAVKTVAGTLESTLNQLLALKWLRLLINSDSSRLPAQFRLQQFSLGDIPLPREIYYWRSRYAQATSAEVGAQSNVPITFLPQVAPDLPLRCQIENSGDQPLYGLIIGVDNRNQGMVVLFDQDHSQVPPQTLLSLPNQPDRRWTVPNSKGIAQWFLLLSRQPLNKTLEMVNQQGAPSSEADATQPFPFRQMVIKQFLPVVTALIADLSVTTIAVEGQSDDVNLISTGDWLTLPIMYQVL